MNLIYIYISKSLDKGNFTLGIFVDLRKAFDTVNHNILLQTFYGIRGVSNDLIRSYLNNSSHHVSFNNVDSNVETISCGIPQASVLGPLLFYIYINDIYK